MTNLQTQSSGYETATLGMGCFWCSEAIFTRMKGVLKAIPGFSGGPVKNPSYREVCTGNTGHAEVVHIKFDPSQLDFSEILKVFWKTHDPTTLNRQGEDIGTQYRSVIFFHSEKQKEVALELKKKLNNEKIWENPIVTVIEPFENFYPAEDYHKEYFANNPNEGYCQFVIAPKVEKFEKLFKDYLKLRNL